ncbi:calcium-binding protein [Methyloprofundus sedimenti]|uniref:Calcium-binding protein n=1 Tax=Methyloprofundus sedimenti TaxID=1420851 RepID=A0A1V8M113_9GAMM|nr:cold shock domain-containing protein [Methyloprofundus sedimenti]OQK15123.1 calcium-binding protein [Methyloprofundus sedimenti]
METKKGKLIRWIDAKGFGFITPENGKSDIFIHITAFKGMGRKPVIGDIIHYEIGTDTNGKTRAVNARIEGVRQILTLEPIKYKREKQIPTRTKPRAYRKTAKPKNNFNFLPAVIFVGIAVFIYNKVSQEPSVTHPGATLRVQPIRQIERFQCQGKVWCTEMDSYEEAVFYLGHCPGTKMDGDGDGIPCERQF